MSPVPPVWCVPAHPARIVAGMKMPASMIAFILSVLLLATNIRQNYLSPKPVRGVAVNIRVSCDVGMILTFKDYED